MEIDVFTLAAQLVNFAILVFFLDRFLFRRVIAAMDERERRIAEEARQLELERRLAAELAEEGRALKAELEEGREAALRAARLEAEALGRAARERTREEAEREREVWRAELELRKRDFLVAMRTRAGSCLGNIAARAIRELSDESLETRMAGIFADRLRRIDGDRALEMRAAIEAAAAPPRVRTSFPLGKEERAAIAAGACEGLGYAGELVFAAAEEGSPGLSLEVGGLRLSWDVETYVRVFEDRLRASIGGAG